MLRAGGDEVAGADVGGVHQVLGRGQAFGGERVVDGCRALGLVHVGRRRVGVDHQTRHPLVTGFGEVDHVIPLSGAADSFVSFTAR